MARAATTSRQGRIGHVLEHGGESKVSKIPDATAGAVLRSVG